MEQKTKLKIIGPYTPEHEGPFCTRDGRPIRIVCSDMKNDFPILGIISNENGVETYCNYSADGKIPLGKVLRSLDLMNAREVPVAREFWISTNEKGLVIAYDSDRLSELNRAVYSHTIHGREVLPGDGQ